MFQPSDCDPSTLAFGLFPAGIAVVTRFSRFPCQTLVSLGFYDDVRQVLGQLNVDIRDMSDEQVISKLDHLLHSAIFEQKRNEERRSEEHKGSKATPEQIRSSFDAEIAFLMTFFKMSIDSRVINAAVYANIVHQADVEISIRKRST